MNPIEGVERKKKIKVSLIISQRIPLRELKVLHLGLPVSMLHMLNPIEGVESDMEMIKKHISFGESH